MPLQGAKYLLLMSVKLCLAAFILIERNKFLLFIKGKTSSLLGEQKLSKSMKMIKESMDFLCGEPTK